MLSGDSSPGYWKIDEPPGDNVIDRTDQIPAKCPDEARARTLADGPMRRPLYSAILLIALLLGGCTEKRYTCEACLREADGTCAKSSGPPVRREESARCAAAEALCGELSGDRFDRLCKSRSHTVMLGCSEELLRDMRIECTASKHIVLPLLIDL